ncbi:hypothetical protein NQ315_011790 [Exocentrus adspersus]|uniref:UBA domain-containing protein n=1 Tax=Exocentrus adspersus TaxID=1586481 RepID=A0AAV8W0W7_9CUCU|nr:hypothetical protein NQ315_011790 [Exocentrus adspersus]
MLEGLVAWVLNNYLGKYVQLNTEQLSIALLSGKVELENLPLKKDALRHLGLPVVIKTGFIGKVQLQVPVRQIRSAPWVIAIEQLYLVASPLPIDEWDHEAEELSRHELKLGALDTLEAKWRLERDAKEVNSTYYASTYSSWYSYGAGLVSEIVENLQLKIQDVHIRYEDCFSLHEQPVAFGVTIESLIAQSCDSNWLPSFVHTGKSESFKLLELQNFALYWTMLKEEELFSSLSTAKLAEAMYQSKAKRDLKSYIVPSVSAQARLKRNCSTQPLRSSTPRIVCDLTLEEVPLQLIDWQYNQIVTCVRGLDHIAKLRSYRQYKPSRSVKDDPKAWWLYAISCFYPGSQPAICRPRPTWESCLQKARENVKYVQICIKLLITPTAALTAEEKKIKEDVEWGRGYEDLKVLRELAMSSVTLPEVNSNNAKSTGRNMLVSWFPTWMGWYSSNAAESASTSSPEATQLEGEILQVLADSAENNTILKRDAVFGHFNFCLKKGTLNLCASQDDESSAMLALEFKNLSLNILSKPRTSSHKVELSLHSLFLKDKITPNTMFPVLVGPPGQDRVNVPRGTRGSATKGVPKLDDGAENLFYLAYEKNPPNSGCDYRLSVKSKCLDVVYQPNAVKWLTEFVCLPHQRDITQSQIEAMKSRTKRELIKNWEQILEGRVVARTSWELELDISAPQIIFVEQFSDHNSSMAVIDFGRLQLRNNAQSIIPPAKPEFITRESEDDETFLTPCSTPPASEASDSGEQTLEPLSQLDEYPDLPLNETSLHQKLYDCYFLELTDLQILIGKSKDNWRYALNKGSSNLHVLDRFNISIQIERRVVHTSDPLYPSLTMNANLPKLTVHLNEQKIISARNLMRLVTSTGLPSPFRAGLSVEETVSDYAPEEESESTDTSVEISRLVIVQFSVDQMSLEVQSRGRCIAELQVSGVKVAFTKRAVDLGITLTVHSLLLVDALQTFGSDFELLVASHKHVGMDSMSGSLRDSEPTSPVSPASPDPNVTRVSATSPVALTQALSNLSTTPPLKWPGIIRNGPFMDAEALITVDVALVMGPDPMQIANIQFNNLDIIANQETIVELMGFIRRVFPKSQKPLTHNKPHFPSSAAQSTESLLDDSTSSSIGTTQLTFDFHRLNVLLLRGVLKDGALYGKKICTATMTEAKIQANVSGRLEVEGSLGGLQVLDLTPEGYMHQRIVSVGRDPLLDVPHPLYVMGTDSKTAFNFKVVRNLTMTSDKDTADVTVRMASLWYTHSPQFVVELQSCATEFKQYLSNLARSIKMAATDMALGLVHARAEALAQSLSMNKRLPGSIYGSALSFSESASPSRRRRRSSSTEHSGYASARDTVPQTPYSPADDDEFIIDLKLDIELDSPVVVLPRASDSPQVFVAHLGKINITNDCLEEKTNEFQYEESRVEHYDVEIRNMNIYSLDTSSRRMPGPTICRPEVMYSCETLAKPVLHDTMLELKIDRELGTGMSTRHNSDSNLLMDVDEEGSNNYHINAGLLQISGSVITALKVSLTRSQYEQVLDTMQWLTSSPTLNETQGISRVNTRSQAALTDISEEDTGVSTLNMDPHVRAKLFPAVATASKYKTGAQSSVAFKVSFDLPVFTVELRGDTPSGEQGLVDLSFRDFIFNYEKCHRYETNVQVSLRSIFMEDLLQPEGCKHRTMVVSSSGTDPPPNASCFSRSCPDIASYPHTAMSPSRGSLPDHLETAKVFGMGSMANTLYSHNARACPNTPPPSPSHGQQKPEKNLVIVSTLLVDPSAPNFQEYYNGLQRSTSVDFNCLDLVIAPQSWVVVIDFFSAAPSRRRYNSGASRNAEAANTSSSGKVVTNVTVRSLTVVLVRPERDIAKANISNVEVVVKTAGLSKEVEGKLGTMSLQDLTLHGQLYRERFVTSPKQALQFKYIRHEPHVEKGYDAQLTLDMTSVKYVHTKRFIAEVMAFFNLFTERQQVVMKGIQAATSGKSTRSEPSRLSLILKVGSPIMLLPVSSKSSDLLIVDLGQLFVTNIFKFSGQDGTISIVSTESVHRCLLDVMTIELENMDLYTGIIETELSPQKKQPSSESFKLGGSTISKKGPSLLAKKFRLKLQVEQNLHKNVCHVVPDMSIYGQLSTLDGVLDLQQYRLIRGLLAFNLGEDTERINPSVPAQTISSENDVREEWKIFSIKLDLQNVTLQLIKSHENPSPLTCINFIKSHLTVETFSNLCQDIDLVSQEILVIDTRYKGTKSECFNVFSNILQPIKHSSCKDNDLVQAEIHSRKRQDYTKVTILLNNMRLMAIFDWWEAAKEYIFQDIENVPSSPEHQAAVSTRKQTDNVKFDLKLNITDSEIVLVENSSQWDTNAVILKSTTVLKYRPYNLEKPLSCSLNNLEMFSCILGMEDETALSIIDPITLNIDIGKENVLEMQLQFLIVRLSYHDMCMFMQMLNSLPKQMVFNRDEETGRSSVTKSQIATLTALGFKTEDCVHALETCDNRLDDAALWLTHHAIPAFKMPKTERAVSVNSVEVKASCISICIIDDCGDSDVPLLQLSFSDLHLHQLLPELNLNDPVNPQGSLHCILASDYYNRALSGWEPILEPWRCTIAWEKFVSEFLTGNLSVKVHSDDVFNINVTSTLMELYGQVKENWVKDYFRIKQTSTASENRVTDSFRRRSPFIPFALKNDTGSSLKFTTHISDMDKSNTQFIYKSEANWTTVEPGETVSFSFTSRDKMRHQDTHKMRMHQLGVKIEGWQHVNPVTVDKVGVYFRDAPAEVQKRSLDLPPVRIVFDVALEGSARKLITVRSALLLINNLPQAVEVKLDNRLPHDAVTMWVPSKSFVVDTRKTLAVPLIHALSQISIRPTGSPHQYTFCMPALNWCDMPNHVDKVFELATCHTHKGFNYRFFAEIIRENLLIPSTRCDQPAHRIYLWPTVKLENLLPIDVSYNLSGEKGYVKAGAYTAVTSIDPEEVVKLEIKIDNFKTCNAVVVPGGCNADFNSRIKLEDSRQRKLYLLAEIAVNKGARLKITVSAYYWIINRTGLPLVFRQSGSSIESAGQFEEHEQARMVAPLLFSFSDQDASPTINARVGKKVVWDGTPQWCSNFHVQKGTQYRKLRVTMRDGRPDTVFIVGLEVRPGRGKYRSTSIVTISPRYQIHNRSSYRLLFAQTYLVKDANPQTCLKAVPNSHMPFHWSNLEKEQLLCVSILDVPDCCWSGGLKIDTNNSLHVNIRDANGRVYFLRLEVVLQGATFFVVFTDADTMPPPIRVDNFSEVSIKFGQNCYIDVMHSTARAHSSVPYAWDEPTKPYVVRLIAPGGVSNVYNMSQLGSMPGLTYENFIYIAFSGTFKNSKGIRDPRDVESQELVMDVDRTNRVILAAKIPGERSQLWRMTSEGHLQHEGSSPPSHPNQPRRKENILVLDIENTAPQPNTYSRLMLRRIDPRRRSTQKWRFTEEGRLCCDHCNMCVQAQDGFYGLRPGNAAVLGLAQPVCHKLTDKGTPIEQAIERQRLHPGSGFLAVDIYMDGPTQVISVKDIKQKAAYAAPDDREWGAISRKQRPNLNLKDENQTKGREMQFSVQLRGLGISLVCRSTPEELLFAHLSNIVGKATTSPRGKQFSLSIKDIQIDNQLLDTLVPVVLYVTPPSSRNNDEAYNHLPAVVFDAEMQEKVNSNAVIFKHFTLRLKKITVIIEERLLLKFFAFMGLHSQEEELICRDENDYETQKLLTEVSAAHAKRYYFGVIRLIPDQIRLSVKTASKLPKYLQRIKKKLGLTLIKFEDAAVDLQAFEREHPFETREFLFKSIIKHFKDELMWQAAIILGSVDYLGNPLGLMIDVSEGLSGFIYEGNVGALVKNVTHGMSNSTAKIAESLSDGLGKVTMDDYHEEMRQKIRQVQSGKSSDHILAGFKGLGFGILGGATGIFKQVYEGASNDGLQGVFTGLGKGLVGAVTKPVVGVLDFASETARAVRDSSRSKTMPERVRPPRCVHGLGGLLPRYNLKLSEGQQYLYMVNNKNYDEQLIAYQVLGSASEDLLCIVSNKVIRIVTSTRTPELTTVIECPLSDLEVCNVIKEKEHGESRYYIEIVMHYAGVSAALVNPDPVKKPRVRCKSSDLAVSVSQQINYAKRMYIEHLYTLSNDNISISED